MRTRVVFRVFKKGGDVLALFPDEPHSWDSIMSYQHVGQHGGANYAHCIQVTRPATKAEYAPLERELQSIGYSLKIVKRRGAK